MTQFLQPILRHVSRSWQTRSTMKRLALTLALAFTACTLPPQEDAPAEVTELAPPAVNGCGWPYRGSIVAPPLPAGAHCYYVYSPSARAAVLTRDDPLSCGHGDRTAAGAACSMRGCLAIGDVRPGQIVDVWAVTSVADPLTGVSFEPHPLAECVPQGS